MLIRFRPYHETEEFVNIGVIMLDQLHGKLLYKITEKDFRAKRFFRKMNPDVYDGAVEDLAKELSRLKDYVEEKTSTGYDVIARDAFRSLALPTESIIQYSSIRTVLVENAEEKLNELYEDYLIDF